MLLKVFGGTGHLADAETKIHALGEHLIIEDEIVAVFPQRQAVRTSRLKAR